MARPVFDSITWSDGWKEDVAHLPSGKAVTDAPLQLEDRELRCWVTYPDKAKRTRKKKPRRQKPKLWAVMIIEELRRADAFEYRVTLRRIYKKGERIITVSVRNDPEDQSDEATVLTVVSPHHEELDSLEQRLVLAAAKRVYYAIEETWPMLTSGV